MRGRAARQNGDLEALPFRGRGGSGSLIEGGGRIPFRGGENFTKGNLRGRPERRHQRP